jgi:hypothetical protein
MLSRRLIALAVCVLAGGCLSEKEAVKVLRKDHPRRQTAMIARIAREGKPSMAGELIRLLDAEDEGVRFMAAAGLHKLTDIDRGIHFTEGEERRAIIQQWRRWYEDKFGEPMPEAAPEPPPEEEDEGTADEEPGTETAGEAKPPGEEKPPDEEEEPGKDGPPDAEGESGEDEPPDEATTPADEKKQTGEAPPPGEEAPPAVPDADEDDEPKEYPLPKVGQPDGGTPPEQAKETAG